MIEAVVAEFTFFVIMALQFVAKSTIGSRASLSTFEVACGEELLPTLMGPVFARRSAFDRGNVERPADRRLDFSLPGVGVLVVGNPYR